MPPRFPTGQIHASTDFLTSVSRSAMIAAIRAHVLDEVAIPEGGAVRSNHEHEGLAFHVETSEDRSMTAIRLG